MTIEPDGPKCRHCKKRKGAKRTRWMCNTCYRSPARDLYPLPPEIAKFGQRPQQAKTLGKIPSRATDARPGSPEKIAVMAGRAKRGESLFHPDDETQLYQSEE